MSKNSSFRLLVQGDGGEVVVGSAQQLANCRKSGPSNDSARTDGKGAEESFPSGMTATAEATIGAKNGLEEVASAGDGEGVFLGLERVSAPKGSVIVWDAAQAPLGETQNLTHVAQCLVWYPSGSCVFLAPVLCGAIYSQASGCRPHVDVTTLPGVRSLCSGSVRGQLCSDVAEELCFASPSANQASAARTHPSSRSGDSPRA